MQNVGDLSTGCGVAGQRPCCRPCEDVLGNFSSATKSSLGRSLRSLALFLCWFRHLEGMLSYVLIDFPVGRLLEVVVGGSGLCCHPRADGRLWKRIQYLLVFSFFFIYFKFLD